MLINTHQPCVFWLHRHEIIILNTVVILIIITEMPDGFFIEKLNYL